MVAVCMCPTEPLIKCVLVSIYVYVGKIYKHMKGYCSNYQYLEEKKSQNNESG